MAEETIHNKNIILLFPCYNEQNNIADLLIAAKKLKCTGYTITCLPINDCSQDNTLHEIKNYSFHFLNLVNNLGIGGAVQAGIKYAKKNNYDYAIQIDGDGQHPIDQIHKLITAIENNNCDICIGSRYINQEGFQSSMSRRVGIKIINLLIKLSTGKSIHDSTSGFRIFNKKAIELFSHYYPDKYPEPESIVYGTLNGLCFCETPVIMKERQGGKSSITGLNSLYYMLKVSLSILFLKFAHTFDKKNAYENHSNY